MRWHLTGLWRSSDFVKFWLGQTVSRFGSGITGIALPLTGVLLLAATPSQMGILSALDGAAVLAIGLFVGVWVDRVRRRPLLIATDLGRAFILGTVPLAALFGVLHIEQLYAVAALTGMFTVIFNVANQSFLPSLIPQTALVEGNSKLGVSDSLAEIGGPAVAGPLVQLISAPFAVLFDAFSFLFSAFCLGLIRKPEPPVAVAENRMSIWHELVQGLHEVLKNPLLRSLAGGVGAFNFFGNFVGALYALYVVRELLAGILGGLIGLRLTILIGVLGVMAAGALLLLSPIRKISKIKTE